MQARPVAPQNTMLVGGASSVTSVPRTIQCRSLFFPLRKRTAISLTWSRWFAVTMGTGIVSVLMNSIPFHTPVLYYLSIVFFVLNAAIFTLALITSVLRYTLYPEIWKVMIQDPTNSLFLATVPMGFATLIEMWIFVCVPHWGQWAVTVAWVLWMIDVVAAASVTLSLSFILSVFLSLKIFHGTANYCHAEFRSVILHRWIVLRLFNYYLLLQRSLLQVQVLRSPMFFPINNMH